MPADGKLDVYSFSWSQLHGSGHSHSCVEGSVSNSCGCSVLSIACITPNLSTVVIFVQSFDLMLTIERSDMTGQANPLPRLRGRGWGVGTPSASAPDAEWSGRRPDRYRFVSWLRRGELKTPQLSLPAPLHPLVGTPQSIGT